MENKFTGISNVDILEEARSIINKSISSSMSNKEVKKIRKLSEDICDFMYSMGYLVSNK